MIGEGPTATTTGRHQPGMAANCAQGSQPGLARDHPPTPATSPGKTWRGTTARSLSQEWPGVTRPHQMQTPARNCAELNPGPSARIGERPRATTSSQLRPGMVVSCAQGAQPGLARGHPPHASGSHTPHSRKHKRPCHLTRDRKHANAHAAHQKHTQSTTTYSTPAQKPTTSSSRPQPGMAGRCSQAP